MNTLKTDKDLDTLLKKILDKKLTIGFFTDTYLPQINGVSENVKTSAEYLRRKGHTVYIFAPKIKGYKDSDKFVIRFDSVRYIKNPEQRFGHPNSIGNFVKLANKKIDIIHCHAGFSLTLLGIQIAFMKGIPIVLTYHTLFTEYTHYFLKGKIVTPGIIKRISKLFCNLSDTVISPSKKVKNILQTYGVKKPIVVIPGGIDINKFSKITSGFIHKNFNIQKNKKVVLYCGRIGKEKNIKFLLEAFKKVIEEVDSVFILAGDGPEKNNLKKVAKELGINNNVIFTGFIEPEYMPSVYSDADVFVFSSLTETQGLVVAEASAVGIPVVALNDNAISEMVKNKKTGFLTESNTKAFSEKVILLLKNKKIHKAFSENSKKFMFEKFSAEIQEKALEEIYYRLVLHYNLHPKLVRRLRRKIMPKVNLLKEVIGKLPGARYIFAKIQQMY